MNRRFAPRLSLFLALSGLSGAALAQSEARLKAISLVKEAASDFARGDLPLVIKICRQALALDPNYPRAYTYLGAAYQKRGERQSACAAFGRVVQIAPGGADATRARRGIKELDCTRPRPQLSLTFRPDLRLQLRWNTTAGIAALAFSPDGSQISGGGSDGAWRLWRASDGRLERLERGAGYEATSTAMGPMTAVGYGNGDLRFFDAHEGRDAGRIAGRSGSLASLSYAPGGAYLAAAGSDGALKIYDARTNTLLRRIEGEGLVVSSAAFSPDARFVAVGVGSVVRIYQVASGRLVRVLNGDGLPVGALAWSRNGLLAGAIGYKIRIWNGATGRLERILSGHRLTVSALAFGNNNLLASGGYDTQLRLWNASSGACAIFAFHGAQIRGLSFDAGGTRLISGDQNGLLGLWRLF